MCVEGHPFAAKKRMSKVSSSSHLPDDVFRGIVDFPKPSSIHDENIREQLQDESGEILARERLGLGNYLLYFKYFAQFGISMLVEL